MFVAAAVLVNVVAAVGLPELVAVTVSSATGKEPTTAQEAHIVVAAAATAAESADTVGAAAAAHSTGAAVVAAAVGGGGVAAATTAIVAVHVHCTAPLSPACVVYMCNACCACGCH